MKVQREEFLSKLEGVSAGLSDKDVVEQASCFVFKSGMVYSFNDETSCRVQSGISDEFEGAVPAKPLLEILRKLPDDEVNLSMVDGHFIVKGKSGRKAELRVESEILLDIDGVGIPKKFTGLHEDFCEAVDLVKDAVGKDGDICQVSLHITPDWIEACDDVQLCRYAIKTGVKENVLIRKESIRSVVHLGMNQFAETASWMHFKNNDGMILSCRRYLEEYTDYTPFLAIKGESLDLPKGLTEVLERSGVFIDASKEEEKRVRIELSNGKLRVIGEGKDGRYTESRKVVYSGKQLSFLASPKMLMELSKRHNSCQANADQLRVDGGKWQFVARLDRIGETKDSE